MNSTTTENYSPMRVEDFSVRCQKVLDVARQLYRGGPDWVTLFREVLGIEGAARRVFSTQEDFAEFEKTTEYSEIQQMVNALRNRRGAGGPNEATRVITVRLPESLHESLKAEATDHNTSMNKLCIAKLLQALADEETTNSARNIPARMTAPASRPATTPTAPAAPATSSNFRSTWNPNQYGG